MKRKKYIKQLMALGIQRNDAAGFVEAYRVIKAKKKEYMLSVIMAPPAPPVKISQRPIRKMEVVYHADAMALSTLPPEEAKKMIKRRLVNKLAEGLLDLDAYTISIRAMPPVSYYAGQAIEYRLTIDVVMPEEDCGV